MAAGGGVCIAPGGGGHLLPPPGLLFFFGRFLIDCGRCCVLVWRRRVRIGVELTCVDRCRAPAPIAAGPSCVPHGARIPSHCIGMCRLWCSLRFAPLPAPSRTAPPASGGAPHRPASAPPPHRREAAAVVPTHAAGNGCAPSDHQRPRQRRGGGGAVRRRGPHCFLSRTRPSTGCRRPSAAEAPWSSPSHVARPSAAASAWRRTHGAAPTLRPPCLTWSRAATWRRRGGPDPSAASGVSAFLPAACGHGLPHGSPAQRRHDGRRSRGGFDHAVRVGFDVEGAPVVAVGAAPTATIAHAYRRGCESSGAPPRLPPQVA